MFDIWLIFISELDALTKKDIILKNEYLLCKINASFIIRLWNHGCAYVETIFIYLYINEWNSFKSIGMYLSLTKIFTVSKQKFGQHAASYTIANTKTMLTRSNYIFANENKNIMAHWGQHYKI